MNYLNLLLISGLAWCLVFVEHYFPGAGIIRFGLGVPFLLLFPGYSLLLSVKLGTTQRVSLSIVLSMLLVSLLGFALNYTPWGITLNSIMVAVAIVITLNSVYSALRLRAVPSDKITHPGGIINTQSRSPILSTVMLVSIIGVISTSIVFLASEKSEDTFTSFFVASSPEGNVAFPKDLVVGQEISVYLVLSNHEGKNCTYDVQQALNGKSNKIGSNILLANGETWNQSVKLRFVSQGPDQKVEFALYKNGQSYLNPVYLWFNIKAP